MGIRGVKTGIELYGAPTFLATMTGCTLLVLLFAPCLLLPQEN